MLRRFNSLIKGSKVQSDEGSVEHVSLRPTRSVDSSLFATQPRAAAANFPLQQIFGGEGLARAPHRSEDGQTSLIGDKSPNHVSSQDEEPGRGFVMGRVPEERSWKEGYEHAGHFHSLDSPTTPRQQYEPGEKPSDFHAVDLHGCAAEPQQSDTQAVDGAQSQFAFPILPEPGIAQTHSELPGVFRTSSDAVVSVDCNSQPDYNHTAVDIPDDTSVDLGNLRKSILASGPGRTISSWSTDSAAEHCRICQQYSEEPLIELGCLCRGEMAKSHKSCIELWFKNRGTNKCEVCQHEASNIPAPTTSPVPHFWVWRLGGPYAAGQAGQASQPGVARRVGFHSGLIVIRPVLLMIIKKHPFIPIVWVCLLGFMTYLFVDAINTSTIGYAAMPIGFLFGVLVVLGLGTAVRLILECCNERNVQRSIRRMELLPVHADTVQTADQNQPPPV